MDKPTLKKTMISSLFLSLKEPAFKDNKLQIVTSFGIIEGLPFNPDDPNLEYEKKVFFDFVSGIAKVYLEDLPAESNIDGNDGYLLLKDVVLRNFSSKNVTNLQTLVVFFDQILAVTIGTMK